MWKVVKAWLNPMFRVLVDLFVEVLPVIKALAKASLRKFADEAIKEVSIENITDAEKRAKAFDNIKAYALAEGIAVRDSVINLLIELTIVLKKAGK